MQTIELLRSMDIFEELQDDQLREIAGLLEEHRVPGGSVLFREGDAGDSMLIVTAGRIRVSTRDASGREHTFAVYGDGEFFGEMGVLTGEPRTATATAENDSGVLVLRKEGFDAFLQEHPIVMRTMLKVIAQRQMQANISLLEDDDGSASAKKGTGRVYAVFSPRGGAGKSMIAANIAVILARMYPDRVALLDLAVTFSHAGLFLGLQPHEGIASIEAEKLENLDRETLNQYAYLHDSSLRVYTGATRPEEGEAVSGDHVRAAIGLMKRQFLFTVVDLPSNFNETTLATLELADKLVLVMTPELAAMRDVREVLRLFNDTIRVPRSKQYYVLNNPGPFKALGRDQFESHLELQIDAEIPHAGESAFKAYLKGEPLVQAHSGAPASKVIEKIVEDLLEGLAKLSPGAMRASAQKGGLFGKLLGKR